MTGDGILDLVGTGSEVSIDAGAFVLEGLEDGTFAGVVTHDDGEYGDPLAGDFDGDGELDVYRLLLTDNGYDQEFYEDYDRFIGEGGFAQLASKPLAVADSWSPLAAVDLDGDGRTDIGVAECAGVRFMLGRGDGSFAEVAEAALDEPLAGFEWTADLTGDDRATW